ncbi:MAG: hypothetical protein CM1200mP39_19940 [Dehalococcoidia bacterium]|nr:MAG: hypothetical protein CM1200mP39_19940 [Dehalococcoidia bacterium]
MADTTKKAEDPGSPKLFTHMSMLERELDAPGGPGVMKRDLSMPDSDVDVDYFMNELVIAAMWIRPWIDY